MSERAGSFFRGFFMLQIPASFQVRHAANSYLQRLAYLAERDFASGLTLRHSKGVLSSLYAGLTAALWRRLHRADCKILRFSVGFQFQKTYLLRGLEQIIEGLKTVRALVETRIAPL